MFLNNSCFFVGFFFGGGGGGMFFLYSSQIGVNKICGFLVSILILHVTLISLNYCQVCLNFLTDINL